MIVVYSNGSFNTIINGKKWNLEEVKGREMYPTKQLSENWEWNLDFLKALNNGLLVIESGEIDEETKLRMKRLDYIMKTSKQKIYQDAERKSRSAPTNWAYYLAILEDKVGSDVNGKKHQMDRLLLQLEKEGYFDRKELYPF